MAEINRHYRTVKSALKKGNLSGTFVAAKYRFSPYMACQHGCLYCDGRAEKYYVEGEFDRDIIIRSNLPDILQQEIPKLREKGCISIGSGVSDAYQPVEKKEGLMERCTEVLARYDFPVTVLTKSDLIQRDIDLWSQVNRRGGFLLAVSLVFIDDDLRRIFEPRTASVEKRLSLLKNFKDRGCHTGILAMPLIPLISDSEKEIRRLYEQAAEIGVDFIMPSTLTLRPGRQKETFMKLIARHFPDKLTEMEILYAEQRQSGVPIHHYRQQLIRRCQKVQKGFEIPWLVPHRIYRDNVQLYDEINILLHHMIELYQARGIPIAPLQRALKAYMGWLTERKRLYNRRRSWPYSELEEELRGLLLSGGLTAMMGNRKLGGFLHDLVIHRLIFDYVTLKIV